MNRKVVRKGALAPAGCAALVAAMLGSSVGVQAAAPPVFTLNPVGPFGGEPSITSDSNGVLYDSTPSGVPNPAVTSASEPGTFRSFDQGASWQQIESPDPS